MNEISNAVPKRSKKQHLERFVALLQEQEGLAESLKGAKMNMEADGYGKGDVKSILAIAKAVSKSKERDLKDYITLMEENLEIVG
jgi:uncharacterized protein (UPF0335 family)